MQNTKKKNMVKGILICALIAVIAIGATLAYLTANTGKKTNKFTSDNSVKGTTTESNYDSSKASDYTPGDSINKNPSITLDSDSESAYVALAVDYYDADVDVTTNDDGTYTVNSGTKISQEQFKKFGTVNGWAGEWVKIATSANGSELYKFQSVVQPGTAVTPELFQSVTVNAGLSTFTSSETSSKDVYSYTDVNKNGVYDEGVDTDYTKVSSVSDTTSQVTTRYVDAAGNNLYLNSLPTFVIDINGYAVQSANIDDATANTQLIDLANQNRSGNDVFTAVQ